MTNIKSKPRIDTAMSEKIDYKITKTETWELIRIRNARVESSNDEYNCYQHHYAYILLRKDRTTDALFEDELYITIIPLIRTYDFRAVVLKNCPSTWSVYADLCSKQIKFAKEGSFQIRDRKLRGQGLGSYILSDLVQWVKQYHPSFSIERLWVKGFDDEEPGDWEQRESLYKGVGFRLEISDQQESRSGIAIAENSSILHENRNPNKVETITLMKFIEILEENCRLRGHKSDVEQSLKGYSQENNKLKSKLVFWRGSTTILLILLLITLAVALGLVFH